MPHIFKNHLSKPISPIYLLSAKYLSRDIRLLEYLSALQGQIPKEGITKLYS